MYAVNLYGENYLVSHGALFTCLRLLAEKHGTSYRELSAMLGVPHTWLYRHMTKPSGKVRNDDHLRKVFRLVTSNSSELPANAPAFIQEYLL